MYLVTAPSRSRDDALLLLLLRLLHGVEHAADRVVEDALEALLRQRGALDVLVGPQLARELHAVFRIDGHAALLLEPRDRLRVVAQVQFRADEYKWDACVGRVDGVWDVSDALERPSRPTTTERPSDAIDATRRRKEEDAGSAPGA